MAEPHPLWDLIESGTHPVSLEHRPGEAHLAASVAISLKRIADSLDGISGPLNAYGETIGEAIQGQIERGLRGIHG